MEPHSPDQEDHGAVALQGSQDAVDILLHHIMGPDPEWYKPGDEALKARIQRLVTACLAIEDAEAKQHWQPLLGKGLEADLKVLQEQELALSDQLFKTQDRADEATKTLLKLEEESKGAAPKEKETLRKERRRLNDKLETLEVVASHLQGQLDPLTAKMEEMALAQFREERSLARAEHSRLIQHMDLLFG